MEITRTPIHPRTVLIRHASIFVALAVGLISLQTASAQTQRNWTSTTSGTYDWSDGANWQGGQIPDTNGESAAFNTTGFGFTAGNVTVNQDISGLTIASITNGTVVSSGTLILSGLGITLNNNNSTQTQIVAGGNAAIPTYNTDFNITDPQGVVFVAQNHMYINGNVTTVASSTVSLSGGGAAYLGGSNSFNGIITSLSQQFIATSTAAYGGSGTAAFNTINGSASTGFSTRATGTTNFNYAIDTGTFAGAGRMILASGGTNTTLNITTSTFLNQSVGNTAFYITAAPAATLGAVTGYGTVRFSGTNFTISRDVYFQASTNTGVPETQLELAPATGTQTWSGNIRADAANLSWYNLNSAGPALVKSGNGVAILSGSNSYNLQTGVNAGTLLVNGLHNSVSNGPALVAGRNGFGDLTTGNYVVNSGGTLGGSGRILITGTAANSNMVRVQSGGVIAPGGNVGAIGTFTLDGGNYSGPTSRVLSMATGAKFVFELDGSGGTPDQLAFWNYVTTDLLLSNNAIDLSLVGTEANGTYTVALFNFFSDGGTTATASGISSGLTVGALSGNIGSASIIYNANNISLQYTVVPEPSTTALLVGVAGLVVVRALRRRVRPA